MYRILIPLFLIAVIPCRIIAGLALFCLKPSNGHLAEGFIEAWSFWIPLKKTSLMNNNRGRK